MAKMRAVFPISVQEDQRIAFARFAIIEFDIHTHSLIKTPPSHTADGDYSPRT